MSLQYVKDGMRNRLRSYKNSLGIALLKSRVKDMPFCIISNDCFGGELYRLLNKEYNTPFIGLMLMGPCYLKLLQHFEAYMALPLEFTEQSKYEELNQLRLARHQYPIGLLNDVEIHFLHYSSQEEAREKWERRKARMNPAHYCFKLSSGKDFVTDEIVEAFCSLPLPRKLCIGAQPNASSCYVQVQQLSQDGAFAFKQSLPYVHLKNWLSGSNASMCNSLWQKRKGYLIQKLVD